MDISGFWKAGKKVGNEIVQSLDGWRPPYVLFSFWMDRHQLRSWPTIWIPSNAKSGLQDVQILNDFGFLRLGFRRFGFWIPAVQISCVFKPNFVSRSQQNLQHQCQNSCQRTRPTSQNYFFHLKTTGISNLNFPRICFQIWFSWHFIFRQYFRTS